MAQGRVERLDHLGVIAPVMNDFGLIDMLDTRLVPDTQAMITPGEAVAEMILNGLGFANRPLSLTPQFFASNPRDLWCREGVEAAMWNRFQLGRSRDAASASGGDRLFQELALAVCAQAGIALRFNHLDTTRCSRSGESSPDHHEPAMTSPHGYSKDHRPDLQQAVLALMVSPDGGGPCVRPRWEGHTSAIQIFQARAQALMPACTNTPSPRYLVAEAKRYHEAKASSLQGSGFLTRRPHPLGVVAQGLRPARARNTGQPVADNRRDQSLALCHDGLAQRWLGGYAQAALERAAATRTQAPPREHQAITKQRFHLQAQRFGAPSAAPEALAAFATHGPSPRVDS